MPSNPRRPRPLSTAASLTPSALATVVLILSQDAVAAALLGGLVETMGYDVRFARPPESFDRSLQRVRPRICIVDCVNSEGCSDEFLGRATMRGVSVIIYGTREALDKVRALALQHQIDTLLMPAGPDELDAAFLRARDGDWEDAR